MLSSIPGEKTRQRQIHSSSSLILYGVQYNNTINFEVGLHQDPSVVWLYKSDVLFSKAHFDLRDISTKIL